MKKHNLPQRLEAFRFLRIEERHIVKLIVKLEQAYEETANEAVYSVLCSLQSILEEAEHDFWHEENHKRQQELEEAFRKLGELPHTVRTWYLDYREDENNVE
jgi:hypothetical protein